MRVVRYSDPAAFWRDLQGFLERDELGNTQLLAVGARHAAAPTPESPTGFALIGGDEPIGAALLTGKGTLFVSPLRGEPLRALHAAVATEGRGITDIVAESATAQACASLAGGDFETHVALRLYRLEAVTPVPNVPGTLRQAGDADFALLCSWQQAFIEEIAARGITDTPAEMIRRRLDDGGAWLSDVGGVTVAHAGHRPTPIRSARIAPVYTLRADDVLLRWCRLFAAMARTVSH